MIFETDKIKVSTDQVKKNIIIFVISLKIELSIIK